MTAYPTSGANVARCDLQVLPGFPAGERSWTWAAGIEPPADPRLRIDTTTYDATLTGRTVTVELPDLADVVGHPWVLFDAGSDEPHLAGAVTRWADGAAPSIPTRLTVAAGAGPSVVVRAAAPPASDGGPTDVHHVDLTGEDTEEPIDVDLTGVAPTVATVWLDTPEGEDVTLSITMPTSVGRGPITLVWGVDEDAETGYDPLLTATIASQEGMPIATGVGFLSAQLAPFASGYWLPVTDPYLSSATPWEPLLPAEPESLPGWVDPSAGVDGPPPGLRVRRVGRSVEMGGLAVYVGEDGIPTTPPAGAVVALLPEWARPADSYIALAILSNLAVDPPTANALGTFVNAATGELVMSTDSPGAGQMLGFPYATWDRVTS